MNTAIRLLPLLVWFGACAAAPEEPAVRALRYRQFIVAGTLEFSHGGGGWYDCLYLPDAGVVCQVTWSYEMLGADGKRARPGESMSSVRDFAVMCAFRGSLEQQLAARPAKSPEAMKPPEEVRIPAALARDIVDLAMLTDRQRTLGRRLAEECVARRAVGDQGSVGKRDFDGL